MYRYLHIETIVHGVHSYVYNMKMFKILVWSVYIGTKIKMGK